MARRRVRVKPGRAQSAMGFVMGIVFVVIGLFVVIPTAGPFGLLWTAGAAAITVINGLNAFGKKGVPTMEIYSEEDEESPLEQEQPDQAASTALTARERLEQLDSLKQAGLITGQEYQAKREEILNGL